MLIKPRSLLLYQFLVMQHRKNNLNLAQLSLFVEWLKQHRKSHIKIIVEIRIVFEDSHSRINFFPINIKLFEMFPFLIKNDRKKLLNLVSITSIILTL